MPGLLERLHQRHTVVRCLRDHLCAEGFLELQAPCLVRGTCPDPFIESFPVGDHYLTASTEYHIKRLMAQGAPRVFTLQSNFRKGDSGKRHNPEFTMLEWGRVGATLRDIERDLETMMTRSAVTLHGSLENARAAAGLDLTPPFARLSVRSGLRRHIGVSVETFGAAELLPACRSLGIGVPDGCAQDATALFSLLVDRLSPALGRDKPVWLVDWPAYLGSSAATTQEGVADRSELFVRGLEVSDGFPFANDAGSQRARFEAANRTRGRLGLSPVTFDERYLRALPQLPAGAGMAVGVDRLVMALLGSSEIADVIAFPWDAL